jgi:hypothetical protein
MEKNTETEVDDSDDRDAREDEDDGEEEDEEESKEIQEKIAKLLPQLMKIQQELYEKQLCSLHELIARQTLLGGRTSFETPRAPAPAANPSAPATVAKPTSKPASKPASKPSKPTPAADRVQSNNQTGNQKAKRERSLHDVNGPQLCRAASKGHLEKIETLLQDCTVAPDDLTDSSGSNALHNACYYLRLDVTHFLVGLGCDVNLHSKNGDTPLHLVAEEYRNCCGKVSEVVEVLVQAGADVQARNKKGKTGELMRLG